MTIQYKNQGINLTTTGSTSVLTCPTDATILIKQIQASNEHSGAVSLEVQYTDTSATATFRIFKQSIAATTTIDVINNTFNLEAGDILKMTADTANEIQGVISYALIDRSQENG
jgi:hypothetical protein